MIGGLERIGSRIWAFHYRLHRLLWWIGAVAAGLVAFFVPSVDVRVAAVVICLLCLSGVVRWAWARRRCRGALVVPLFFEGGGAEGRGEEAQRIVVDTLRERLPAELGRAVQPLPVVIGSDERKLGEKTRKRLGAHFLLHGRVASRPDGGWSVFPRILEGSYDSTIHLDWFTRDRTPASPRFGPFVSTLPPQRGVLDEEFPLDFCRDLEAVIRGIGGRVAVAGGSFERGIELLDQALAVAGDNANPQIEALRVDRANALRGLGKGEQAIRELRERARRKDCAPVLLRALALHLLLEEQRREQGGLEPAPGGREEQIAALQRAREALADPLRDQTTYNLFAILDLDSRDTAEREENDRLLEELLNSTTGYQRQWYVRRAAGLRSWRRMQGASAEGDGEAAREAAREAGTWYSRAIRARPKIQIEWPLLWIRRIPPSPILYANAVDGHRFGGRWIRAWWCEARFRMIRRRYMSKGWKAMRLRRWELAYFYYDWVSIVGRGEELELRAHAFAAICAWKAGYKPQAEQIWAEARKRGRVPVEAKAELVERFLEWGVDPSVPGAPVSAPVGARGA